MTKYFPDRLRLWEDPELREARTLARADFEKFGLPEEQVDWLFADDSQAGVNRRRRIHGLGEAFHPIVEHRLRVPPECERLFEGSGPLTAPLPMTGRTIVESAFDSEDEFAYAEDFLRGVCSEVGSFLDA